MKFFSDSMPEPDEPLPEQLLLRIGWVEGLLMTGLCLVFTIGAVVLIVQGRGMLAFFALFAFAPGLAIGWRQLRSGGYFVLMDQTGLVRSDYGQRQAWRWDEIDQCVVGAQSKLKGAYCRLQGGRSGDEDVLIESGGRDPAALADLINRYQKRARRSGAHK